MHTNKFLISIILVLFFQLSISASTFNIRDFGAKGDKITNNAQAIQAAIDACHKAGGGTVYIPQGDYLSGGIQLKSNITLHLENGATLWASTDKLDYEPLRPGGHWCSVLLRADNVENIAITGQGVIHGQGYEETDRRAGAVKKIPKYLIGPIYFTNCKHVAIRDITIRYSQTWTVHLWRCEKVFIDGVTIFNNYWRGTTDGFDINACRDVHISNCNITAGDDAICIKADHYPAFQIDGLHSAEQGDDAICIKADHYPCENIVITNCILESVSDALKIDTNADGAFRDIAISNCIIRNSTKGIGFYIWHTATVERVTVSNCSIETLTDPSKVAKYLYDNIYPIFMDVDVYTPDQQIGKFRDISFNNIYIKSDNGVLIQGAPESTIDNLTFRNITLDIYRGYDYSIREKSPGGGGVRNPNRLTTFARLPSYVTFAHVNGLMLDNVRVRINKKVFNQYDRSALSINETVNGTIKSVFRETGGAEGKMPVITLNNCQNMFVTNCIAFQKTPVFIGLSGAKTKYISLVGNDLRKTDHPVTKTIDVPQDAIISGN